MKQPVILDAPEGDFSFGADRPQPTWSGWSAPLGDRG